MGLIEKAVKFAVEYELGDAIQTVRYKTEEITRDASETARTIRVDAKRAAHDRFLSGVQRLQKKEENRSVLFLKRRQYTWNDKYEVFDADENVVYAVKGELLSLKRKLSVYDTDKQLLGTARETLVSLRSPLSMENLIKISPPFDCDLYIDQECVGRLSSEFALGKRRYVIKELGWTVEGTLFGGNIKITDAEGTLIAEVPKRNFLKDYYAISVVDPDLELIALLIVLAVTIDFAGSKSNDYERNINHAKREAKRAIRKMRF